jgi:DNA-binding LacI/PurR family transcriptional regulator
MKFALTLETIHYSLTGLCKPIFSESIRGVQDVAGENGDQLIPGNSDYQIARESTGAISS